MKPYDLPQGVSPYFRDLICGIVPNFPPSVILLDHFWFFIYMVACFRLKSEIRRIMIAIEAEIEFKRGGGGGGGQKGGIVALQQSKPLQDGWMWSQFAAFCRVCMQMWLYSANLCPGTRQQRLHGSEQKNDSFCCIYQGIWRSSSCRWQLQFWFSILSEPIAFLSRMIVFLINKASCDTGDKKSSSGRVHSTHRLRRRLGPIWLHAWS